MCVFQVKRHVFSVCLSPACLQDVVQNHGVIISRGRESIIITIIFILLIFVDIYGFYETSRTRWVSCHLRSLLAFLVCLCIQTLDTRHDGTKHARKDIDDATARTFIAATVRLCPYVSICVKGFLSKNLDVSILLLLCIIRK